MTPLHSVGIFAICRDDEGHRLWQWSCLTCGAESVLDADRNRIECEANAHMRIEDDQPESPS